MNFLLPLWTLRTQTKPKIMGQTISPWDSDPTTTQPKMQTCEVVADESIKQSKESSLKPAPAKAVPKPAPAPAPAVIRRAAPVVLPVSVATHTFIPVPATQSAKADKVAHYISVLNTDIEKNHKVFMDQYNAELAKLRDISKKKLYTEEEYLKAQRELNAKYKVWKDTLHAFSVSNSTLSSLRHHNSSFTEEKNLLTHLYEYVKMFSTKQGYYKHNCVCNATIVGDLRSVQSATTLS